MHLAILNVYHKNKNTKDVLTRALFSVSRPHTTAGFGCMRAATNVDHNLDIMPSWKTFTTANAIIFIKAEINELKLENVNAC